MSRIASSVVFPAVLLCGGCVKVFAGPQTDEPAFLRVELVSPVPGERGTSETPLPLPRQGVPVTVRVTALDKNGVALDCAAGHGCADDVAVSFGVSPGWIPVPNPLNTDADPANDDRARAEVPAERGQITGKLVRGTVDQPLTLRGVFSQVHVWAEVFGAVPESRGMVPTVASGRRSVTGVSDPMHFMYPSLQDLQVDPPKVTGCATATTNNCDSTSSPLIENFIETRTGRYLVTGITNEGFFVTDIGDIPVIGAANPADPAKTHPGRFRSLFVFNFSYPDNLLVGDVVTKLFGTVQEFTGDTQITFPAWDREDRTLAGVPHYMDDCSASEPCPEGFDCQDGRCRIRPIPLTEAICADSLSKGNNQNLCGDSNKNVLLEGLESDRVEIAQAIMPTKFVNCDLNGDGDVPNKRPNVDCAGECECKQACVDEAGCTELSALYTYGQYAVTIDGPKKFKINVITRDSNPLVAPYVKQSGADALLYGGVKVRVRGNLRQSLPARPKWIVVAMEPQDFCCLEASPERCGELPVCR